MMLNIGIKTVILSYHISLSLQHYRIMWANTYMYSFTILANPTPSFFLATRTPAFLATPTPAFLAPAFIYSLLLLLKLRGWLTSCFHPRSYSYSYFYRVNSYSYSYSYSYFYRQPKSRRWLIFLNGGQALGCGTAVGVRCLIGFN